MTVPADTCDFGPRHPPRQEIDVWYGAMSPWALLVPTTICALLTAAALLAAWLLAGQVWLQRGLRLGVLLLWLVQGPRLLHLLFGCNYRLTNFRLFRERGVFAPKLVEIDVRVISDVRVEQSPWQKHLSIGNLVIKVKGKKILVLKGIGDPQAVVDLIDETRQKAID